MRENNISFPYESFRKGQKELSEEVAKGVSSGELVVVKAPTGFGKTIAVLYGVLKTNVERVFYVVRTVNEIDPVLRELKNFDETYTFLFSARRVCPLIARSQARIIPSHEDFWKNCAIARLKGLCEYYYAAISLDESSIRDHIVKYPDFHAQRIALDISRKMRACPFFALLNLISSSRVIVATYPYLFEKKIFSEIFYDYKYSDFVVIVDEAHNLLNAQSLAEQRINIMDLEEASREIEKYEPEALSLASILRKTYNSLASSIKGKWKGLRYLDKSLVLNLMDYYDQLVDVEEEIREVLVTRALIESNSLTPVSLTLSKVVRWIESLKNPDYHLFTAIEGGNIQLVSTPVDPMVVARDPVDYSRASVLMSGTMPSLEVLKSILGLSKPARYIDVEFLYGPLTPQSNIFTIVVSDVTSLYRERGAYMYDKIARYLTTIARSIPGLKLAVYPSYDFMRSVVDLLPLDLDIVVETSTLTLGDVEDRARESANLLINAVAGGKLVEGVEFTDSSGRNILHIVVIVGVPFPHADDFTEMAVNILSNRFKSKNEARRSFYLTTAITRVRQALGRGVRSPEDRAVFILLDYRYLRRDIKELLRLRYDRVINNPDSLEEALHEASRLISEAYGDS